MPGHASACVLLLEVPTQSDKQTTAANDLVCWMFENAGRVCELTVICETKSNSSQVDCA